MRERREIIKLAGQLQGAPLQLATLAKFIEQHALSSEELAMLQGELISNVVALFSTQQASASLLRKESAYQPATSSLAFSGKVPTLAVLSEIVRREAMRQPVYLAGNPDPWQARYSPGGDIEIVREGESRPTSVLFDQLYAFPYNPKAGADARQGRFVRYYYPGQGLDLIQVDQVALVDANTGSLQLSNGRMIPMTYVTSILDRNLS